MRAWKRLVRSEAALRWLCWLVHLYVRVVFWTGRWIVEGRAVPERLLTEHRPIVLAFWHGRLLMIPMTWQRLAPMHMLISAHRDGRIIAGAVAYFGIDSVAGSSSEGGLVALRKMVKHLRAGDCVGITPDGPNGPAMRASLGVVATARLARAPIVPVTYATSRRRILDGWDRFHLPLPFGRGVFIWGEPIHVPAELSEADMEAWRAHVEARMNALTAEADRRVGHEAVAPGILTRREWNTRRRAARAGGAL